MADETQAADASKLLQISKYPNRRYYDKTRSKHLTLEEIYAAIRDGFEIHVTDSRTGSDITAKVLAQIILELDPPKLDVFPVPLLHRLLRANEQLISDFTHKYFNQALAAFLDSQKKAEQYLRQAMGLGSPTPTMADWAKVMWGPFNPSLWNGSAPLDTAATPTPPATPPATELQSRVEQLQQQLVQLQQRLTEAETPSPKPPARKNARRKSYKP